MEYIKSFFNITSKVKTHETAHTHILITYGSETGCAKGIAEYIYENYIQVFVKDIYPLNDIEILSLTKYDIVIILLSTTGDGEFPTNANKFWRKIRKYKDDLPIKYILCGFGSYDYKSFCHSSKCLERKLKKLGACELMASTFINNEDDEDIKEFINDMQKCCDYIINEKQKGFVDSITTYA